MRYLVTHSGTEHYFATRSGADNYIRSYGGTCKLWVLTYDGDYECLGTHNA